MVIGTSWLAERVALNVFCRLYQALNFIHHSEGSACTHFGTFHNHDGGMHMFASVERLNSLIGPGP